MVTFFICSAVVYLVTAFVAMAILYCGAETDEVEAFSFGLIWPMLILFCVGVACMLVAQEAIQAIRDSQRNRA